jgi:hypothetical protein
MQFDPTTTGYPNELGLKVNLLLTLVSEAGL